MARGGDEELLELAEDFGNLTETAQLVLRDEMKKRGLAWEDSCSPPNRSPRNELPETASMAGFEKGNAIFGRWSQAVAEQNRQFDAPARVCPRQG